jgi:hypothetical protein
VVADRAEFCRVFPRKGFRAFQLQVAEWQRWGDGADTRVMEAERCHAHRHGFGNVNQGRANRYRQHHVRRACRPGGPLTRQRE